MRRVIITGGAGFIGSHLCESLLKNGQSVVCVDDLSTGNKENIKEFMKHENFSFIRHNVIETVKVNGEIDQIFHLASRASPPNYQSEPVHTMLTNAVGTNNLIKLALEKDAIFLFSSTSEVYGDPEQHPQKESYWGKVNPVGVRSCYDESKRFGEALCMAYLRKLNAKIKIARIFNTYGPKMQRHDGRVVTNLIDQALKNQDMTIYGDGNQTRAFCYVDDMIKGIYKMMNSKLVGPVNLGNPNEFSILELANMIKRLTKSKSKFVFKPLPEDDPLKRRPDISLAKRELGWEPKVGLEEGLKKTIDYFKKI